MGKGQRGQRSWSPGQKKVFEIHTVILNHLHQRDPTRERMAPPASSCAEPRRDSPWWADSETAAVAGSAVGPGPGVGAEETACSPFVTPVTY